MMAQKSFKYRRSITDVLPDHMNLDQLVLTIQLLFRVRRSMIADITINVCLYPFEAEAKSTLLMKITFLYC